MQKSSKKHEKPTKKHIETYLKRKANHIRRVGGSIFWAGARGPRAPPLGRTRPGLPGPARLPKNATTNPSYMVRFPF